MDVVKDRQLAQGYIWIAGTSGYSFQMTLAVNMGKTGSSIKSAEIKGINFKMKVPLAFGQALNTPTIFATNIIIPF